ncbi:DUF416 family protein [Lysobacter sp. CA199]|uniref:DUF416 family protein n=1 Tax=Lysobacter sp. CA199 TaxID=3455608 RepID=UPI003F8D03D1
MVAAPTAAPHWKCVSFMAYCCKPMLANYRLYRCQFNRGNVRALRRALDTVWDWAQAENPFSGEAIEQV